MIELAETVAGWPLAASIAAAVTFRELRAGRRRTTLNEALHELRRPLQSIVLATDSGNVPPAVESSVQLATAAVDRLEREVNGGEPKPYPEIVAARPIVESAVARWKARASLAGGSLALRWEGGEALVESDRFALAQAIDNLIVNAIEHGGPDVIVAAGARHARLRIAVADSGCVSRPASRRETPAEAIARLSGRRRRGHGLAVVRRVAAAHGGRFALRRAERGSLAVLELPLAGGGLDSAA